MSRTVNKVFCVLLLVAFSTTACGKEKTEDVAHPESPVPTEVVTIDETEVPTSDTDEDTLEIMITPPPEEALSLLSMERTGILFLIDASESVLGRNQENSICTPDSAEQGKRYQVPEFTISVIAGMYPESTWPKIGVIEFRRAQPDIVFELEAPSFYYKNIAWQEQLYAGEEKLRGGTYYLDVLQKVEADIDKNLLELDSLTIVIISDGWLSGEGENYRDEVQKKAEDLLEKTNTSVEFVFINVACPGLENQKGFMGDKNMWVSVFGEDAIYNDGFDKLLPRLFEGVPSLSALLRGKQIGWLPATDDVPAQHTISAAVQKFDVSIVSLAETARYEIMLTRNEGEFQETYEINSIEGHINKSSFENDGLELDGLGCDMEYKWALIFKKFSNGRESLMPELGFYWWKTKPISFILDFEMDVDDFEDDEEVNFSVKMNFLKEYHLTMLARRACFTLRWTLQDASGKLIKHGIDTFTVDDCLNGVKKFTFEKQIFDDYTPPLTLNVEISDIGEESKLLASSEYELLTIHPSFNKQDSFVDMDNKEISLIFNYLGEGNDLGLEVFALTEKSRQEIEKDRTDCLLNENNGSSSCGDYALPDAVKRSDGFYQRSLTFGENHVSWDGNKVTYFLDISTSELEFEQNGYNIIEFKWENSFGMQQKIHCYLDRQNGYCEHIADAQ